MWAITISAARRRRRRRRRRQGLSKRSGRRTRKLWRIEQNSLRHAHQRLRTTNGEGRRHRIACMYVCNSGLQTNEWCYGCCRASDDYSLAGRTNKFIWTEPTGGDRRHSVITRDFDAVIYANAAIERNPHRRTSACSACLSVSLRWALYSYRI